MKKFISLILAVVMVMVASICVYALSVVTDDVMPAAVCPPHSYGSYTTIKKYSQFSDSQCELETYKQRICTKCGDLDTTGSTYSYPLHSDRLHSASCNGSTQTIIYRCKNCGHLADTEYTTCPGGPHTGSCRWLPV